MWGPSIAPRRMGSVWLTSPSFQSPLDLPLGGQRANQSRTRRRHGSSATCWLVGAGRGDSPCPFIDDPVQRVKATGHRWQRGDAYWILYTSETPFLLTGHTEVHGPQAPCVRMNPVQGSPSQDAKQLHQKEEMDTEGEDLQPKDMTTEKGYKMQRISLPFSVESLISKKTTTCRTSYSVADLAAGQQGVPFSPRTLYAESKVSAESSQGVSSSSSEDSPQFSEKDQSTWYQTSSFSTPPRKSVPLLFWEFCKLKYTFLKCVVMF